MDGFTIMLIAGAAVIYGFFVGRSRANRTRELAGSVKRGELWGLGIVGLVAAVAIIIVYVGG